MRSGYNIVQRKKIDKITYNDSSIFFIFSISVMKPNKLLMLPDYREFR